MRYLFALAVTALLVTSSFGVPTGQAGNGPPIFEATPTPTATPVPATLTDTAIPLTHPCGQFKTCTPTPEATVTELPTASPTPTKPRG